MRYKALHCAIYRHNVSRGEATRGIGRREEKYRGEERRETRGEEHRRPEGSRRDLGEDRREDQRRGDQNTILHYTTSFKCNL